MKLRIVVSLFNGMGTLRQALHNLDVKIDKYYSSEIKPYAIELQQFHFPDVIQVGDINNWREWNIDWSKVDFIGSGSPCQDLSIAGKRAGLEGNNSSLFWVFVDILNHVKKLNPNVLFLQENVGSAPKKDVGIMSRALGVYPARYNSHLVTAQNRDRYYWTNIKTRSDGMFGDLIVDIAPPKDKDIYLKDIIESGQVDKDKAGAVMERHGFAYEAKDSFSQKYQAYLKKRYAKSFVNIVFEVKENTTKGFCEVKPGDCVDLAYPTSKTRRGRLISKKSNCLMESGNEFFHNNGYYLRKLSQVELERLQGFTDGYTSILSYNQAASVLGDGWTLPIIEHILKFML